MSLKSAFLSIVALACVASGPVSSAETKFKGYMFGDYYYVASGSLEERNGFQFRRIYFTTDLKWNDRYSGRFRLEAADAGFGSNEKMTPVVKDAWLRYQRSGHTLVMGLSPTPSWDFSEGVWGYRSVEKTLMDLNGLGASRDTGLRFTTRLGEKVALDLMVGNGNSNKAEGDNGKKAYSRLHFRATPEAGLILYADWENRPGDRDRTTFEGFAYRSNKKAAIGIEGVYQRRNGPTAINVIALSVLARVKTNSNWGAYGRVDFSDPNNDRDDDRTFLFIGGVDFEPTPGVHVMPNLLLRTFEDPSIDADLIPRVTLHYIF